MSLIGAIQQSSLSNVDFYFMIYCRIELRLISRGHIAVDINVSIEDIVNCKLMPNPRLTRRGMVISSLCYTLASIMYKQCGDKFYQGLKMRPMHERGRGSLPLGQRLSTMFTMNTGGWHPQDLGQPFQMPIKVFY